MERDAAETVNPKPTPQGFAGPVSLVQRSRVETGWLVKFAVERCNLRHVNVVV